MPPDWLKELTDLMQINSVALFHIVLVITGAITAHCHHRLSVSAAHICPPLY